MPAMIANEQKKTVCGCFVCNLKLAAKGGLRDGTSLFCPVRSRFLPMSSTNMLGCHSAWQCVVTTATTTTTTNDVVISPRLTPPFVFRQMQIQHSYYVLILAIHPLPVHLDLHDECGE